MKITASLVRMTGNAGFEVRRLVAGSTTYHKHRSIDDLLALDRHVVPDSDAKFKGFSGCQVTAVLDDEAVGGMGIFVAGDGMHTDPIAFEIVVQGILMHTDAEGQPLSGGGPLRLWFPAEAGLRCSSGNPLSVKDVRSLTLSTGGEPHGEPRS